MGVAYFLVCMDCKTGVYLGKAVRTKYSKDNDTYGFSDVGHSSDDEWVPCVETAMNIDRFLMKHRTHELRVLPDNVEKYASNIGFPHGWPDEDGDLDPNHDRAKFLNEKIKQPDSQSDLENLPLELIEKLKKF